MNGRSYCLSDSKRFLVMITFAEELMAHVIKDCLGDVLAVVRNTFDIVDQLNEVNGCCRFSLAPVKTLNMPFPEEPFTFVKLLFQPDHIPGSLSITIIKSFPHI